MTDEIEPEKTAGSVGEEPATSGRGRGHRGRNIVVGVVVLCLVAGGVSAAIATSGGSSTTASTPAGAVNRLVNAVERADVLGELNALVPGERSVAEPGLLGLAQQLERLKVLSSNVNFNHVSGFSLHFAGLKEKTKTLSSTLAAVSVTVGSVSGLSSFAKLPLGSFLRGLVKAVPQSATSKVAPQIATLKGLASVHHGVIVTEKVGGTWYVSLGYTIAYDALRASGRRTVPPPAAQAVPATGASTPEGAVTALLDDAVAFNLRGLIGDLPPGEEGALQTYAPLFLGKAQAELAKLASEVKMKITSLTFVSSTIAAGTLVRVTGIGFSLTYKGITLVYKGGSCVTYSYQGHSGRLCVSKTSRKGIRQAIGAALPSSLRALAKRLVTNPPALGFVTVSENGHWFVSPVATMLDGANKFLAELRPADLAAIASLVKNPAEVQALGHSIEQALGGAVAL
jgi:hypothetical protein